MKNKARAMVLASFQGDALALAAHWIYDTKKIDREIGSLDRLQAPVETKFHPTKNKGDFTHYGDQTLLLLRHLADNGGFDLDRFGDLWRRFAQEYTGYIDHATKSTLAGIAEGKSFKDCGSDSGDLGGPARIAPLVYWYRNEPDKLLEYARQQTRLTHCGTGIAAGTDFLVRTTLAVLGGKNPGEAIEQSLEEGVADMDLDMRLAKSLETGASKSREVIGEFGQMCNISAALPGAMHLVLAYPDNPREAFIQNVMAGGDSAARGLVVGMLLGAHLGEAALDTEWMQDLQARQRIETYLDQAQ